MIKIQPLPEQPSTSKRLYECTRSNLITSPKPNINSSTSDVVNIIPTIAKPNLINLSPRSTFD